MISEKTAAIVTEIPGPKSRALLERRLSVVARGVSYGTEVFAAEAKGALIKDVDGNVFIDFAAGIGVINAGHCDDEVVAAIREQAGKYIHTSFNVCMYEPYVALAEKLTQRAPGSFPKKVMFANSGAEAVENAVKIARKYTGKPMVVSLESAFHGRTYMAMTLTSKVKPYKDGFAPYCSDTFKIPSPYYYRSNSPLSEEAFGYACAQRFADQLKGELSPDMIAAVIIEPVQGEGGFIVPPKSYLVRMQEICRENGIVLIIDEIQSGFGRTGRLFCCEHAGIEPDLITMSKSIAGGLPLSAVVGRAEIMDAPGPGGIGGTFGGNPVSCAAALKVLELMDKENLPAKAEHIGRRMLDRLRAMQEKYPVIGQVRGLGAMLAIELVKDPETKQPDKEIVGKIISACTKKGVILMSAGLFGNCIRFLPPLVMTDEQIDYGMDVLDEAIKQSL